MGVMWACSQGNRSIVKLGGGRLARHDEGNRTLLVSVWGGKTCSFSFPFAKEASHPAPPCLSNVPSRSHGVGQSDSVRYCGSHSPPGTKGTQVPPIKRPRQSAEQVGNPAWTMWFWNVALLLPATQLWANYLISPHPSFLTWEMRLK